MFRLTSTGTAATLRVDAGTGPAINGISTSNTGQFGQSTTGTGVVGAHIDSAGPSAGVEGRSASGGINAAGVLGRITAATPGTDSAGVRGVNSAANGYGVFGENTGTGTNTVGVFGKSGGYAGVLGKGETTGGSLFSTDTGVYGCAAPSGASPCPPVPFLTAEAVGGQFRTMATDGIGVLACTGSGSCSATAGNPIGAELFAFGSQPIGVLANSLPGAGQSGGLGVEAFASGLGAIGGLFDSNGTGMGSVGLWGIYDGGANKGNGVIGQTNATDPGQVGVLGLASGTDGVGVKGTANVGANAVGVLGSSSSGLAGRFDGDVRVTGKLTKDYAAGTPNRAIPIAYGLIKSDGSKLSGTANVTSSFDSASTRYLMTIAGESYTNVSYITVVTPLAGSTPLSVTSTASSGRLVVKVWNLSGNAVQNSFSFVTYKP
ncbi:MAG TPA: hypothetical protein VGF22_19810 [Acidimicrobiales bacterium]